jgi:hypothetical protein
MVMDSSTHPSVVYLLSSAIKCGVNLRNRMVVLVTPLLLFLRKQARLIYVGTRNAYRDTR